MPEVIPALKVGCENPYTVGICKNVSGFGTIDFCILDDVY